MSKLFVYGILKRGFDLDLTGYKGEFIGEAKLPGAVLYGIGPLSEKPVEGVPGHVNYSGVGLRFTDDSTKMAYGEVFEIPDSLWDWLDSIEHNGFSYTRKIVPVLMNRMEGDCHVADCYVYEHTFPGMRYQYPIENGVF